MGCVDGYERGGILIYHEEKGYTVMKLLSVDNFVDFECIGGDCPISCCGGRWGIYIDDESMDYYMSVEGEFGERLRNSITKINGDHNSFKLDEKTKDCVFLNEDKLCTIYRTLGPDALCYTCKTYPRFVYSVGDIMFCYLTNSCPEVNRMILQRKDPMQTLFDDSVDGFEETADMDWNRFNNAIRAFTAGMHIIQNRSIALRDRLLYLLLYVSRFQELMKEDKEPSDLIAVFSEPSLYTQFLDEIFFSNKDYACKIHAFMMSFRAMISDSYDHPMWQKCIELADIIGRNEINDAKEIEAAFAKTETEEIQIELEQLMAYRYFAVFMKGYDKTDYLEQLAYEYVMYGALNTYIAFAEVVQEGGCTQEDRILFISLFGRIDHSEKRKKDFTEAIRSDGFYEVDKLLGLII